MNALIKEKFKGVAKEQKHITELIKRIEKANAESLRIAKESIDQRLEKLNELREDFSGQQNLFATKSELSSLREQFLRTTSAQEGGSLVSNKITNFIVFILGGVIVGTMVFFLTK